MKKIFTFAAVLLMVFFPMAAEKMASLPDLMRPDAIISDQNQLFILDGIYIYIYSSTDFKLQKKVGKEGLGPQEFKKIFFPNLSDLTIHLRADHLVVNSTGKVSILSRNGEFMRETKINTPLVRFTPLGKKYGGFSMVQENKLAHAAVNLYDSNFKKEKEMFRYSLPWDQGEKKRNPILMAYMDRDINYFASADTLFVPSPDGTIHAFNEKGDKVFTIQNRLAKIKIDASIAEQADKVFSEDIRFKRPYKADKAANMIDFGKYLPIIRAYRVKDQKVYVISNKKKEGTNDYESCVFSATDGTFLKNIYLPLEDNNILEPFPFDIDKGKIYQVVENEEQEEWELHVTLIK